MKSDTRQLFASTFFVFMLVVQFIALLLFDKIKDPNIHQYISWWLWSSVILGFTLPNIGYIRRLQQDHTFADSYVFAMALGPAIIFILLLFFIPELEYVRLSKHRGFYIPTKEKNKEYVSKILSGKIKPFNEGSGVDV